MELSEEQIHCLSLLKQGHNLVVTALAGAGKTFLALRAITQSEPHKRILLVSYNRKLVDATKESLRKLDQEDPSAKYSNRVFVATYHSLLSSIAKRVVEKEIVFEHTLKTLDFGSRKSTWRFSNIDLLIVDEVQDMRPSFMRLLKKIIYELCYRASQLQIFGVGDTMQLLYSFFAINPADARFLTLMPVLFSRPSQREWKQASLSISYRNTAPMAKLLNALIPTRTTIPRPRKNSIGFTEDTDEQDEPCVTWVIGDLYKDCASVIAPIAARERGDLLVLCQSLNERSPAVAIVDALVAQGLDVHVSRSGILSEGGNSHQNQSVTRNKVLFNTKCGAKGLQSKTVVTLINDPLIDGEISNADYVSLTRAHHKLFIFQNYRKITQPELEEFVAKHQFQQSELRVIVLRELKKTNNTTSPPKKKPREENFCDGVEEDDTIATKQTSFSTESLFSFIDVVHLQQLLERIDVIPLQMPITDVAPMEEGDECSHLRQSMLQSYFQNMNKTFDEGRTYVNMSVVCGIALTMALEFVTTGLVPTLASRVLVRCASRQDEKHAYMARELQISISQLQQQPQQQQQVVFDEEQVLFKKFKIFARLAAIVDAFYGYNEKLMSIKNYAFIDDAGIYERFRSLRNSLTTLIAKHDISAKSLIWHREEVGRFKYGEDTSVKIMATPTISSRCGTLVIDILHSPQTNDDDHLAVITSAQIVGNDKTFAYQINIGDGSIHMITLKPKVEQKSVLPAEVQLACSHGTADMDDIATIQEALDFEPQKTTTSLDFVSEAITFKLFKETPKTDSEFIAANDF